MNSTSGAASKRQPSRNGQPQVIAVEPGTQPIAQVNEQLANTSATNRGELGSSALRALSSSTPEFVPWELSKEPRKTAALSPVNFQILDDGTILEIIRPEENDREPSLLVWKSGKARVVERYEQGKFVYVPQSISPGLFTNIQFPPGLTELSDDTSEVFGKIQECIRAYVAVGWEYEIKLSLFILATWIADRLTSVPYLLVQGPFGSGKTTLLKLLSCLCRRSILLSGFTPSEFFSLPLALRPTLLLDETIINPEMSRLLRAGHTQDVPVMRNGQILDLYSPKVISSRESILDTALVSRCIQIKLQRSQGEFEILNSSAMRKLALEWQPRLLAFRLRSFDRGELPTLDTSRVSARTRDLAKAFAAIFPANEEGHRAMVEALVEQDNDTLSTESAEPAMFVLLAIFDLCHKVGTTDDAVLAIGSIAKQAEQIAKKAGEQLRFSPRGVGHHVRTLGFSTIKGRQGCGLWLSGQVKEKLHRMAREHDVAAVSAYCPYCLDFWPKSQISEARGSATPSPLAQDPLPKKAGQRSKPGTKRA